MKRLMVVVAVSLASVMAIAAQCEGKTQKGERCKREAAEGSKFCIGHADQAKKPDAKEKDDGQCWAVTDAGTRCKHKKDGESDYCRQHAPSVKPSKPITQCCALNCEGKVCTLKPEDGKRYCARHVEKGKYYCRETADKFIAHLEKADGKWLFSRIKVL